MLLVTGATGFVGSAVARTLLARGEAVRVTARKGADLSNLTGLDVEIVEADLRDQASMATALKGCSGLYHVAADYRLWTRKPAEMFKTNVDGTVALMRAAADAGVSRVVYTSSVATLGLWKDGRSADEETPVSFADMVGPYKQSKFKAEEAVLAIQNELPPVVVVNPSTPIGPRDIKPTPTGRTIQEAALGKMPAYVDTGLNIVHVDDVAEGHVLAFERGTPGECYILGGDNMSLKDILSEIARLTGRKPPKVRLPNSAVYPVALISEAIAWATFSNKEPMVTRDALKMAKKLMYFTSAKAERELGYTHRPAVHALKDAIEGFGIKTVQTLDHETDFAASTASKKDAA